MFTNLNFSKSSSFAFNIKTGIPNFFCEMAVKFHRPFNTSENFKWQTGLTWSQWGRNKTVGWIIIHNYKHKMLFVMAE